ncbi:MAG: AAA family ATPase, partial [Gammaproteobacteria bacterium]|nr:AAA family ATPase [Gammaproteobacteria bacterium]
MSHQASFQKLKEYAQSQIIGQPKLINRLMIALLADGH